MTLRVIGAGIGRTGTTSLKIALEELGFDKCYHMEEVPQHPSHIPIWLEALKGDGIDWDALFSGYQSAVDLPTYVFYEKLMGYFPAAKVILTIRDPDKWYESASRTIMRLPPPQLLLLLRLGAIFKKELRGVRETIKMARKIGLEYFFDNDISKENALKVFNRHNLTVQQTVPEERLLVYEAKQGWGPLCSFLDVPVPDRPYPHANTREEFGSRNGSLSE